MRARVVLLCCAIAATPAKGQDYWVGVGAGQSFGGQVGGAIEYREGANSGIFGIGNWEGEFGATFAGRGRVGATERAFWELGYGPIAYEKTTVGGVVEAKRLINGGYLNLGYTLQFSDAFEGFGSVGFGFGGGLAKTAWGKSTIPTASFGVVLRVP